MNAGLCSKAIATGGGFFGGRVGGHLTYSLTSWTCFDKQICGTTGRKWSLDDEHLRNLQIRWDNRYGLLDLKQSINQKSGLGGVMICCGDWVQWLGCPVVRLRVGHMLSGKMGRFLGSPLCCVLSVVVVVVSIIIVIFAQPCAACTWGNSLLNLWLNNAWLWMHEQTGWEPVSNLPW